METNSIEQEVSVVVSAKPQLAVIETPVQAEAVSEYRNKCKGTIDRIAAFFKDTRESAHKTWKGIIAQETRISEDPVKGAEWATGLLKQWAMKVERDRQEAQRIADEAARKAAIQEAKKDGDAKLAKDIEKGKVAVIGQTVEVAKPEATSFVKVWKAEVVDMVALCKAIGAGKAPPNWVTAETGVINRWAASTKGAMSMPGIRCYEDQQVRSKR